MNPWESGSMPGRGILPTPNNNLSINPSQAELVIVSNLLNNLIRTQQEPQPQVKKSEKEQLDVKKNNEKPITENVVKSEEAEESQDKKRDWKDEKKDVDATVVKKTDDKATAETRHADSRYSAVPKTQMICHVCNKRMWDGSSLENHLRGRAHQLMMEKLDEAYKLKVDSMRHELRVSEEQREMSLNNSKRRGNEVSVDLNIREYCTMCDLNFYGTLSSHRQSEKHQQLKTFFYPRCVPCLKEFPSRIEYDEHRLTPGHMINTVQAEEQKKTKKQKLAKGESEVCNANDEEKDTQINEVNKTTDKDEEPLTDNTEYSKQIKIASSSMIKKVQGYHCDKCRKFMLTPYDVSMHLKTMTHKNFAAQVKLLTAPVEKVEETVDTTTATPIETPTTETATTTATADESSEMKVDEKDTTTEEPSTVNDDDDNKEKTPIPAKIAEEI